MTLPLGSQSLGRLSFNIQHVFSEQDKVFRTLECQTCNAPRIQYAFRINDSQDFIELKLTKRNWAPKGQKPKNKILMLKQLIIHIECKYWVMLLSCTPVLAWGEEPELWGCKSAIWEKEREGVDFSLNYPGEVELVLKYPTLVSWVHFKHNILDDFENVIEEMIRGKRFFNNIGKKINKNKIFLLKLFE